MIKTGTTCSNDMYFNCDGALKAIKETKVRSVFTKTLADINGDEEVTFILYILFGSIVNVVARLFGFHRLYTFAINMNFTI